MKRGTRSLLWSLLLLACLLLPMTARAEGALKGLDESQYKTSELAAVSANVYTGKTTADLNLRKEMKLEKTNILQVIPKGKVVVILSREKDNWYQVQYKDAKGYVKGGYLIDNPDVREATSNLRVRSAMDTSANNVVVTIPKGGKVEVIESKEKGWLYVCYQGKFGYASGSYLKGGESAKTIDLKNVRFDDRIMYYDGEYHKLPVVKNLPAGVKVTYSSTATHKNLGEYKVKATFSAKNGKDKLKNAGAKTAKLIITVQKNGLYKTSSLKVRVTKVSLKGEGTVKVVAPASKKVKTVKIPATVKIGGVKFGVTEIGRRAFYECKKLKEAKVGKQVKTIGKSAFAQCPKLTSVTLGSSVKTLDARVFKGDKKLAKITIKSEKLKKVGKNVFRGISPKAVIKVPKKKLKKYRKLLAGKGQGAGVVIQ